MSWHRESKTSDRRRRDAFCAKSNTMGAIPEVFSRQIDSLKKILSYKRMQDFFPRKLRVYSWSFCYMSSIFESTLHFCVDSTINLEMLPFINFKKLYILFSYE